MWLVMTMRRLSDGVVYVLDSDIFDEQAQEQPLSF